jgi:histidinol-phosphate phosphatase family protein
MKRRKHRAVFLDRDGVVNRKPPEGDYIKRWSEFEFLPNVKAAIKKLNKEGFLIIVASNQRGIAKGFMTEDDLEEIHLRMKEELKKAGAVIDGIYYCPHDIEEHCGCRKPEPGLLLRAAREHDIDLDGSWMIGDGESDIEAGKRAGCKTILVGIPQLDDSTKGFEPDWTARSLAEGVDRLLSDK